jgi:cell division transport system permease protein
MFINFRRIAKSGIITFWRNGWVSFATVLVMIITLSVVGALIIGNVVLSAALTALQDKVDITVYFQLTAEEQDMVAMRDSLVVMKDLIASAEYVSREQALEEFKERHKANALIQESLNELGDNPLSASLNIKAVNPSHYQEINDLIMGSEFAPIVNKINYQQNQIVIDKLSNMLHASRRSGVVLSIVLAIIAFLVAFNTIRMAIYTSREEVKIMKLVGASNWYTRGPFLVEGFLHGFFASIITVAIFYPLTYWLGPRIEEFFGGPNIFVYYQNNVIQLFLVLFLIGIIIGIFSSAIAVRRYLKSS